MISKSKLGAIAFMAGSSLAFPASLDTARNIGPSVTGGGSPGYNHGLKDYRLKPHHIRTLQLNWTKRNHPNSN